MGFLRLVGLVSLVLLAGCAGPPVASPPSSSAAPVGSPFPLLERQFGARLGVYAVDTGSGRAVAYRADDRFAYDSTYKLLVSGVLLRRDSDAELARVVRYSAADLQSYAPVTSQHVGTGMSVRDLIAAALEYSDNTAANLLLAQVGGPAGLQAAMRDLGDSVSHIDRTEPTVNEAVPGDVRDTSTPRAMGTDLRAFALGDLLPAARRQSLVNWLVGNTTGGSFVRAGVPTGWRVGDKTGNGGYGSRNDIAVVWPPTGPPVVIAVLSDRGKPNAASGDALIADATRDALAALGLVR